MIYYQFCPCIFYVVVWLRNSVRSPEMLSDIFSGQRRPERVKITCDNCRGRVTANWRNFFSCTREKWRNKFFPEIENNSLNLFYKHYLSLISGLVSREVVIPEQVIQAVRQRRSDEEAWARQVRAQDHFLRLNKRANSAKGHVLRFTRANNDDDDDEDQERYFAIDRDNPRQSRSSHLLRFNRASNDHFLRLNRANGGSHFLRLNRASGDSHFLRLNRAADHFLRLNRASGDSHFLRLNRAADHFLSLNKRGGGEEHFLRLNRALSNHLLRSTRTPEMIEHTIQDGPEAQEDTENFAPVEELPEMEDEERDYSASPNQLMDKRGSNHLLRFNRDKPVLRINRNPANHLLRFNRALTPRQVVNKLRRYARSRHEDEEDYTDHLLRFN